MPDEEWHDYLHFASNRRAKRDEQQFTKNNNVSCEKNSSPHFSVSSLSSEDTVCTQEHEE